MNQTRVLLLFAWLFVAAMLWMNWNRETATPPATVAQDAGSSVPQAPAAGAVPDPSAVSAAVPDAPATARQESSAAAPVVLENARMRVSLAGDGGAVVGAELLDYAQTTEEGSPPVRLLDDATQRLFVAQVGLVSGAGVAPTHESAFRAEGPVRQVDGGAEASFVWEAPEGGLRVRRIWRLEPDSYVVGVRDEIANTGTSPWSGSVYRQLLRVPPVVASSAFAFNNPENFAFAGAAWYSAEDKYEKRKFDDYEDGPLDKTVAGGWIAMVQHHFLAAWVPDSADAALFQLGRVGSAPSYLIREVGPVLQVAPGATATSQARLWVGPKIQAELAALAPGLDRAVDYSSYSLLALLADGMFKVLAWLHALTGNWGWAIVLLVVLIKLALFKLSETQYKSFARMRRLQPKMEALKDRYGEDKQKYQMAVMELYKKEKVNPAAGCLPILVQMPVFLVLYWVLSESVELRHAVWIPGWIDNLTARDPFFILPVLNAGVMWATQKLSPMAADPIQRKMMMAMPLVFGVMFAFFPAGLVLYWVTNGLLGLLQQWWLLKRHGEQPAKIIKKS
ncbi:membrane protein insertase YidC [Coralloluteibacterium stylophorae]|uniref:Membrane protein insertase YidC n=1 Tax=Coralloluteibacterium stylophorae TaxID=1776034 RepID=A0A8J7VTT5_9GAMM|nr:membrane protein insertase YidC [Coralloluteibacterium stylophorae]MBS7458963.1 membrane protein insertase YidC [Coralloluteibacterium stylophorae]